MAGVGRPVHKRGAKVTSVADHRIDRVSETLGLKKCSRLLLRFDKTCQERPARRRRGRQRRTPVLQNWGHIVRSYRVAPTNNQTLQNVSKPQGHAGLRAAEVARRLGVTSQTVRNWIDSGELKAHKRGKLWIVDRESYEAYAASRPASPPPVQPTDVEARLVELTEAVERLASRESATEALVEALSRERDRWRAEAAAAKEAALRVNSAAEQTHKAVEQLLEVLALQADALRQLLAPASVDDVLG